jgi:uncharacterized SAM-binding protein YcdF (DUF218 family)
MIYLHKILPFFLSPIFIVLALAAIGVITRRRRWVVGAMGLLYVASMPLVAESLFSRVEQSAERVPPSEVPVVDAIVVLSAGMDWIKTKNGFVAEWPTPSRFLGGVELFHAGRAPILVFTAGKLPWQQGEETEGEILKSHAERMQIPASNILLTESVENTEQEARGVRRLLTSDQKKISLVTSAFHMKRARQIFEREGFEVIPYPVDMRVSAADVTPMSFLPNPGALTSTHAAMREMLGRVYYQLKHEINQK